MQDYNDNINILLNSLRRKIKDFVFSLYKTLRKFNILLIIFLIITIITTTLLINTMLLNHNVIQFERFKTREEAQNFLEGKYNKGNDVQKLLKDLQASKATCQLNLKDHPIENFHYDKIYGCHYATGWISINPLIRYIITIYTDANDKIINFYIAQHKGF